MRTHEGTVAAKLTASAVADSNGCLVWTGPKDRNGYGKARVPGIRNPQYTHRLAYELARGPIPEGLEIDHLCRNRSCCNPDHLEAVTRAENVRRANWPPKTHCLWGHEFTPENTYLYRDGRRCRECGLRRDRESRRRRETRVDA